MGRRIGLKTRVWQECCVSREGSDGPISTMKVYKLEESKEEGIMFVGVEPPEEPGTQQVEQLQTLLHLTTLRPHSK